MVLVFRQIVMFIFSSAIIHDLEDNLFAGDVST